MRFIEELRGTVVGKAWILGCGSSLDDYDAYPGDFFADKVSIAVNWAYIAYPNSTYIVEDQERKARHLKEKMPVLLDRCLFLLPPELMDPPRRRKYFTCPEYYNEKPYYFRWKLVGKLGLTPNKEDFEHVAKCIAEKRPCPFVSSRTSMHWAPQAAALMGAKKIILVGCEHKPLNGKYYAQKRGMSRFYSEHSTEPGGGTRLPKRPGLFPLWQKSTRWLAEAFQATGVEIVRYYYDKGYENII